MNSDWKSLEADLAYRLKNDSARTTPGSGNSKGEEDVVGKSVICQCKYTEQKNITILNKDLQRLRIAAKLLNKFPIFASEAKNGQVLSLILDDEFEFENSNIIQLIIIMSRLNNVDYATALELSTVDLNNLSTEVEQIGRLFNDLKTTLGKKLKLLSTKVDAMIMHDSTYNLFDGE